MRGSILWVAALTVALLLPFLNKAFHIDDPMYLWAAQHIRQHPLDFYGFDVNWYGKSMPMHEVNKNPPLVSYYIALASLMLGWSEPAMHFAFLLPAVGCVLGTYVLAKELDAPPAIAAVATLVAPIFLVSATTIMSDLLMLCFWVWAVTCWVRGLGEQGRAGQLFLAGVLAALAALTKYFGASLIPLLAAYALFARPRRAAAAAAAWAALLVPVLALVGYQLLTKNLYGRGLLLDLGDYASSQRAVAGRDVAARIVTALAFLGGGAIGAAALFISAARRRERLAAMIAMAIVAGALMFNPVAAFPARGAKGVAWLYLVQLALFVTAALAIITLCASHLRAARDRAERAKALLPVLWIAGTLAFTAVVNWTVSARALLPAVPAAAILAARMLDRRGVSPRRAVAPLAASAAIALLVAYADLRHANSARTAAAVILERAAGREGNVWFTGHWGFQWYMQQGGRAKPLDAPRVPQDVRQYDLIVTPDNTTSSIRFQATPGAVEEIDLVTVPVIPFLATMQRQVRAGFYSDLWGPLPYAFGRVPPEMYRVNIVLVAPKAPAPAPPQARPTTTRPTTTRSTDP